MKKMSEFIKHHCGGHQDSVSVQKVSAVCIIPVGIGSLSQVGFVVQRVLFKTGTFQTVTVNDVCVTEYSAYKFGIARSEVIDIRCGL